MDKALPVREEIEARADSSAICSAAKDIFREYDIYKYHWEKTREHMAVQRAISDRCRKKLYEAIAARDGEFCAECKSTEKLQVDHVEPIAYGGLSVVENLQLLCSKCNNKKGVF